jgi:hypothetical protein
VCTGIISLLAVLGILLLGDYDEHTVATIVVFIVSCSHLHCSACFLPLLCAILDPVATSTVPSRLRSGSDWCVAFAMLPATRRRAATSIGSRGGTTAAWRTSWPWQKRY